MSKPHASLSPKTNLVLIPLWAVAAAVLALFGVPHPPWWILPVGSVLGVVGGWMQHLSFRQAAPKFSTANSLLSVRAAFASTVWGRRYLIFLYVSKGVLLVASALSTHGSVFGLLLAYLAGYAALMFVREIVTLPDSFRLARIVAVEPSNAAE